MTTIFVAHTKEDAECAEHIREYLEAKGYTPWREPASLTLESILYPRTIENVILGSAAVVLVWSSSAASAEWVERHILFVQQLRKPIVPVVIDGSGLPNTLIVSTTITSQAPCTDAVAQLLPRLPPPGRQIHSLSFPKRLRTNLSASAKRPSIRLLRCSSEMNTAKPYLLS
jgi:hypothetical protein